MKKRHIIALTAATAVLIATSGAVLIVPTAAATATSEAGQNFINQLANKLGLEEDKVETAVTEIREEFQAEREAEVQEAIEQAVSDGEITVRQGELLEAMHEYRSSTAATTNKPELDRSEWQDLSAEERQTKMEELRTERNASLVEALNENGLNTNADEIQELQDKIRDLDLNIGTFGKRGAGGLGRGMGRM